MKKSLGALGVILALLALSLSAVSTAAAAKPGGCATIQGGTITDSAGSPLSVGFDEFGYNYQARLFVGTYDSSDRNLDGTYWGASADYVDDQLIMKWSDDWLSNRDCDGDGKLDRGADAGGISQGWLTNQVNGDYDSDGDGTQDASYTYFVKIVWVGPGGSLWGQYEIVQEVYNDPVGGVTGLQFKAGSPGFGLNDHWTE
ncbi:MAG: hypothetical protein Q8P12_06125 [bacterium]|nr:hypothetical protein [bacterium]MDZ4231990.1 hypothetical protein [Candidatus Pacearchaeota archaeon]